MLIRVSSLAEGMDGRREWTGGRADSTYCSEPIEHTEPSDQKRRVQWFRLCEESSPQILSHEIPKALKPHSRTSVQVKEKESHLYQYTAYPTHHSPISLLQESKRNSAHNAQPHNRPASLLHLLVVDHTSSVPRQMPQAVERVVSERQRDRNLRQNLKSQRPRGEAGSEHGALEVPADSRRDQVQDAENVEAAGEGDAGDAVERATVPGDLRLVDAEMGRDGAVQALFGEDRVRGLGGGHGCGGGGSVVRCGVSGRKRPCGWPSGALLCLPALCGEGSAHGDCSRSREPAGRCLGGHWEGVSWECAAQFRECMGGLTPPQGLLCDSLCQHVADVSGVEWMYIVRRALQQYGIAQCCSLSCSAVDIALNFRPD
jgi:hypothetical protein